MRLRDRVALVTKTGDAVLVDDIPAYVGYVSAAMGSPQVGRPYAMERRLEAIVGPDVTPVPDPINHAIRWRGTDYPLDGVPLLRVRNGKPHHYTIQLELNTG